MSEEFELYVKNTSNCEGVPLTAFRELSDVYQDESVNVRFEVEDEYTWLSVVGWTDLFGGSACTVSVAWVENSGQVGVLIYGGNSGVRILSKKYGQPIEGVDDHLPPGFGQPWVWITREDAGECLPQDVLSVIGEEPIEV